MGGIVLMLGIGLIAVNGSQSGQLTKIWKIFYDKNITDSVANTQMDLVAFAGEILLLIFATTLASKDRGSAGLIITLEVALWVLWAVKNPSYLSTVLGTLSGKQTWNGLKRTGA